VKSRFLKSLTEQKGGKTLARETGTSPESSSPESAGSIGTAGIAQSHDEPPTGSQHVVGVGEQLPRRRRGCQHVVENARGEARPVGRITQLPHSVITRPQGVSVDGPTVLLEGRRNSRPAFADDHHGSTVLSYAGFGEVEVYGLIHRARQAPPLWKGALGDEAPSAGVSHPLT
jgi:hypothetical protein